MIQVRRLGHATFTTSDIEREVDYWTNIMGLAVIDRTPDRVFLGTQYGHEAIALVAEGDPACRRDCRFRWHRTAISASWRPRCSSKHGVKCERSKGISPGVEDAITFTTRRAR